jgi:hypothetical protein
MFTGVPVQSVLKQLDASRSQSKPLSKLQTVAVWLKLFSFVKRSLLLKCNMTVECEHLKVQQIEDIFKTIRKNLPAFLNVMVLGVNDCSYFVTPLSLELDALAWYILLFRAVSLLFVLHDSGTYIMGRNEAEGCREKCPEKYILV